MKPLVLLCALPLALLPQGRRQDGPPPSVYRTDVPTHAYDCVIGKVGATTATICVLSYSGTDGTLAYGTAPGQLTRSLPRTTFPKDEPVALELTGLAPGKPVYWQLRLTGESSPEQHFVTARPAGSPVTFGIQADSHLDGGSVPAVYLRSLAALKDCDFVVDLGDTFMVDKYRDYTAAHSQYLAQRYYFDQAQLPWLFVNGNHDGERGADPAMAEWARKERLRYFPSAPENYWAFTSGDALLIGLDPYRFTTNRPRRSGQNRDETLSDNWYVTLGKEQYTWLQKTLAASKARWKFVFIHNLVGGLGRDGRGGAEAAPLFEWGGKSADGTDRFTEKRPGWAAPIHTLLKQHGVTAVFHGHDHLFAKQEHEGIVYQCVPQPSHGRGGGSRSADEYGYKSGTILDGSGILKVSITAQTARVVFLRTDRGEPTPAFDYTFSGGTTL